VVVCCREVRAGEVLQIDDREIVAAATVPLGHKLALVAIAAGAKVTKYGMPIGSATADVPAGGWVHGHNLASDRIASHSRDTATG